MSPKSNVEKRVKDIRRNTRKKYSAEEKIRIILEGLRGEETIASICRKESIAQNLYTISGAKTFWRQVRSAFPEISSVKPTALK